MNILKLKVKDKNFNSGIHLPSSKSISNRLLIIRALTHEYFGIENLSTANDTKLMNLLLNEISDIDASNQINILDAQDAGTVFRFLTALLSSVPGNHLLTGSPRIQERPIGILVEALRKLGAEISYQNKTGFPPLLIEGRHLHSAEIEVESNISSQFITALLLISPRLEKGLVIHLKETPSSLPYIKMTIELMRYFGIKIQFEDSVIVVSPGSYKAKNIEVEADWSAAAFWYQAVAFSENGKIKLKGLHKSNIQGDAILAEIFESMGVETIESEDGILIQKKGRIQKNLSLDFTNCPDIAIPVIAACAGLEIIGNFKGLESLKIKESDRVQALETELAKLGFDFREVDEHEWVLLNSCKIEASDFDFSDIVIETYHDHRIAMGFAAFAILGKGIQIKDPDVVVKSYPDFWEEFSKIQ